MSQCQAVTTKETEATEIQAGMDDNADFLL